MEIEQLIKTITRQVLESLDAEASRENLLVFGNRDDTFGEPIAALVNSPYRVFFLDDDLENRTIDRHILPQLTINQMGDLSQGMARGRIAGQVLGTVLKGKTVEVVEYAYTRFRETAPPALVALYDAQKQILQGFGIKPFEAADTRALRLDKQVVTQRDVQAAMERKIKVLKVPQKACITLLAAEAARENSIEILKQQGLVK